jgi:hypothetical protein
MLTALDLLQAIAQECGTLSILVKVDLLITGLAGEEMSITMEVIKP